MPVIIDSAVMVKITMAKMKMLMPVLKCAFNGYDIEVLMTARYPFLKRNIEVKKDTNIFELNITISRHATIMNKPETISISMPEG